MVTTKEMYTIIILEDEVDILALYSDYVSRNGHGVLGTYLNADTIFQDIDIEPPDVYIIGYRLPGHKNGIDIAIEILNRFPSASILFITAFELLHTEISKNPIFYGKNTQVLVKPVKLDKIEKSMLE